MQTLANMGQIRSNPVRDVRLLSLYAIVGKYWTNIDLYIWSTGVLGAFFINWLIRTSSFERYWTHLMQIVSLRRILSGNIGHIRCKSIFSDPFFWLLIDSFNIKCFFLHLSFSLFMVFKLAIEVSPLHFFFIRNNRLLSNRCILLLLNDYSQKQNDYSTWNATCDFYLVWLLIFIISCLL